MSAVLNSMPIQAYVSMPSDEYHASVNWAIIGSGNGLSVLPMPLLELGLAYQFMCTKGSKGQQFSIKKMYFKMSSAKCQPFLLCLNVFRPYEVYIYIHTYIYTYTRTYIYIYGSVNGIFIWGQVMACHPFGAKPLPEPVLTYSQWSTMQH